ncbi:hypothetical protein ASPCAL10893 [Aspergillus calidoustus]|uniref:Uncharacterized protein n=1 Tax=Aspergillus calidoustus TaxID=454130 RepID=A0A0U5CD79_ASPCI|nr:hypothetical protein ASPCAL10893 [Aspergillus calidoustus]
MAQLWGLVAFRLASNTVLAFSATRYAERLEKGLASLGVPDVVHLGELCRSLMPSITSVKACRREHTRRLLVASNRLIRVIERGDNPRVPVHLESRHWLAHPFLNRVLNIPSQIQQKSFVLPGAYLGSSHAHHNPPPLIEIFTQRSIYNTNMTPVDAAMLGRQRTAGYHSVQPRDKLTRGQNRINRRRQIPRHIFQHDPTATAHAWYLRGHRSAHS